MATYNVEPLLTPEERQAFFDDLKNGDDITLVAWVKNNFPEVFDHAAAAVKWTRNPYAGAAASEEARDVA